MTVSSTEQMLQLLEDEPRGTPIKVCLLQAIDEIKLLRDALQGMIDVQRDFDERLYLTIDPASYMQQKRLAVAAAKEAMARTAAATTAPESDSAPAP